MLRDIDDPFYLALAAGDIAVAEVRADHNDKANAMVSRVRRADRGQVVGRIALARADKGDINGAVETLQKIPDDLYRSVMQGRLAATRAVERDTEAADKMFAAAIAGVEAHSGDADRRALTFAQIGRLQAVSGDSQAAVTTLTRALHEAEGLPAATCARTRSITSRAAWLAPAMRRCVAGSAANERSGRAGVARAGRRLDADQREQRIGFGQRSGIRGSADRCGRAVRRARHAAAAATTPLSQETIDAARRAVRNIEEKQPKPAAFAALAAARVKTGDVALGASIFKEALEAADAIPRSDQRAAAYVDVVAALNDRLMFLGQPAREEK